MEDSNRIIKFRAWDKKHNKIANVYTLGLTGIEYTTICTDGQLYSGCGKDDIELMQYTGLQDKNGKEIYESDIINTAPYMPISENGSTYFEVVKWDDRMTGYIPFNDYEQRTPPEFCEVIGNVFETPELLNNH